MEFRLAGKCSWTSLLNYDVSAQILMASQDRVDLMSKSPKRCFSTVFMPNAAEECSLPCVIAQRVGLGGWAEDREGGESYAHVEVCDI